jgi:hypothetical protein
VQQNQIPETFGSGSVDGKTRNPGIPGTYCRFRGPSRPQGGQQRIGFGLRLADPEGPEEARRNRTGAVGGVGMAEAGGGGMAVALPL